MSTLSFGALAAEREREWLPDVFVPLRSFTRLQGGRKVILLGNRGAGKTAALAMLAKEARDRSEIVVELTPEDYSYELLSEALEREKAGSWAKIGAYAAAWKQLLYVLAMRATLAGRPGLKTGPAKRIYTFLRDNYRDSADNPIGTLLSYLKRLEGVKIGNLEASVKARELQSLYRLEELDPRLEDLEALCRARPAWIFVDELDRGWDASEDAVAFVAGLFQAATGLTQRTPSVKVIASLRRELYDNIPTLYDDAQKVRDTIEVIDWRPAQLKALICRRIQMSTSWEIRGADLEDVWERVMPPTLGGRQSFDALLGYTLFRPRELIQLCSLAVERSSGQLPIQEDVLEEALEVYSAERFQDLMAEYRFQFPDLGSVLETFRGCASEHTREDLEFHLLRIAVGELSVSDDARVWLETSEPGGLIDVLWRVGFLRAEAKGKFVGFHEIRTLNTRLSTGFRIHELFSRYLGCR